MKKVLRIFFVFNLILFSALFEADAQLDGTGNAPDFSLIDIDGNEHHLYEYLDSGKVVVLDFFAVWCGICQSNTPVLESIYEKYGPEGSGKIELLSLEADNSTTDQQVRDFVEFYNTHNPHINQTGSTGEDYNITGFPYYYVVAPDRSYRVLPGIEMNLEDKLSEAIETSPGLRDVENDIRLAGFMEPKGTYCNEQPIPVIELQNYGKNTVTDTEIEMILDGYSYYIHRISETISPYEYFTATLPAITDPGNGWHEVSFRIISVNNYPDAEDNNGTDKGDFLFLRESSQVEIILNADGYPRETYWQVLEEGKIAAERDGFLAARKEYSDTICLEQGHCYTFRLFDRYGDGLSEGGALILFNGEQIASVDHTEFNGDIIDLQFCLLEGSSGIADLPNKTGINVYPNPSSGNIYLEINEDNSSWGDLKVFNNIGQVIFHSESYHFDPKKPIDLSAFSDGIVFLRISIEDQIITKKILIQK
jgi:thiol-disulfide isomerase/thioredoxin